MRLFKVTKVNRSKKINKNGRYYSMNPVDAAKKAFTQICRMNNIRGKSTLIITLQETTKGSKHKLFSYKLVRSKLPKPIVRFVGTEDEFTIRFQISATAVKEKTPKTNQGGNGTITQTITHPPRFEPRVKPRVQLKQPTFPGLGQKLGEKPQKGSYIKIDHFTYMFINAMNNLERIVKDNKRLKKRMEMRNAAERRNQSGRGMKGGFRYMTRFQTNLSDEDNTIFEKTIEEIKESGEKDEKIINRTAYDVIGHKKDLEERKKKPPHNQLNNPLFTQIIPLLKFCDSYHDFNGDRSVMKGKTEFWDHVFEKYDVFHLLNIIKAGTYSNDLPSTIATLIRKRNFETEIFNMICHNKINFSMNHNQTDDFHYFTHIQTHKTFTKFKYRGTSSIPSSDEDIWMNNIIMDELDKGFVSYYVQDIPINKSSMGNYEYKKIEKLALRNIVRVYPAIQLWDGAGTTKENVLETNTIDNENDNTKLHAYKLYMEKCEINSGHVDPRHSTGHKPLFSVSNYTSNGITFQSCSETANNPTHKIDTHCTNRCVPQLSEKILKEYGKLEKKLNDSEKKIIWDKIYTLMAQKRTGDWGQAAWVYNTNLHKSNTGKQTLFISGDRLASLYSILLGNPTLFGGVGLGKKGVGTLGLFMPKKYNESERREINANINASLQAEKEAIIRQINNLVHNVYKGYTLENGKTYTKRILMNLLSFLSIDFTTVYTYLKSLTKNENDASLLYNDFIINTIPVLLYSSINAGDIKFKKGKKIIGLNDIVPPISKKPLERRELNVRPMRKWKKIRILQQLEEKRLLGTFEYYDNPRHDVKE